MREDDAYKMTIGQKIAYIDELMEEPNSMGKRDREFLFETREILVKLLESYGVIYDESVYKDNR